MKKKLSLLIGIILCLVLLTFVTIGFSRCTDIMLKDYKVAEDGLSLQLNVERIGSMGYTRGYNFIEDSDGLYLAFYSTFGGLNSQIGSRNTFDVKVAKSCNEVYIYKGEGVYALVLKREEGTNNWVKVESVKGGKGIKF